MFVLFVFAAAGLFLLYFLFLSVFGQDLNLESIPTMAVVAITVLLLVFFTNSINAALAMTYHAATKREKISLTKFYSYALDRAQTVFGLLLVRELIWLLLIGPFVAIYVYLFEGYQYVDVLLILYGIFMTFIIHMLFTPSFLLAGAFGSSLFDSLKHGADFLRRRHVFFVGLYIVFAIVWLLNFLPFLQIATIFFIYPLIYTAMILMVKRSVKVSASIEEAED